MFVAPALVVIARLLRRCPCSPALMLSLTDFDLYALADLAQPALRRPRQLRSTCCTTPLFWQALGNTLYFVAASACRCRSALSLGAALLLNSQARAVQGASSAPRYFAPVVTTLVAVAVVWRYLFHTRYGLHQLRARDARHRADRLARRSALGDAGDHPVRGVEELRLQHDHLPRRRCRAIPRRAVRGGAHRRRTALAAVPARHAADARADAAARRHPHDRRLLPALRRAVRDDAGRAAAEHGAACCTSCTRKASSWWNLGTRVGGRVRAVRRDLRGDGRADAAHGPRSEATT